MEPKDIKITIPEGYEIDMEKSTFERIVFKKKKVINSWEDLKNIKGVFIDYSSNIQEYEAISDEEKYIFLNEKYAKSALALAQISQLLPYYDSKVNWGSSKEKYCIDKEHNNKIIISKWMSTYHVLAFNSKEEAERFLKYNGQLVKDYYML